MTGGEGAMFGFFEYSTNYRGGINGKTNNSKNNRNLSE